MNYSIAAFVRKMRSDSKPHISAKSTVCPQHQVHYTESTTARRVISEQNVH